MTGLSPAREHILIVDDDQSIRFVISQMVEYMGHEAVLAGNGKEGMKSFGRSAFDLVITDLDMPEANGLALAAFIKERSPHTPVVLITGSVAEALEGGPIDMVVHKPFTQEELEDTVHMFLPSTAHPSGQIHRTNHLSASAGQHSSRY
jgi:DNA-binding NtrC family response regulator